MMIQLTLMSMLIPAISPIRNEPGMAILLFMKVDVVSDLVFLFARAVCGYPLILQSQLKGSSRRQKRSLRRKQDLQDTRPQALFTPALVPAGHRRPRPEALRQFTPGRAGAHYPQHAFHHQAMIDAWTAGLWLLVRPDRACLLPLLAQL